MGNSQVYSALQQEIQNVQVSFVMNPVLIWPKGFTGVDI